MSTEKKDGRRALDGDMVVGEATVTNEGRDLDVTWGMCGVVLAGMSVANY